MNQKPEQKKKRYRRKCFVPNQYPDKKLVDVLCKNSIAVEQALLNLGCNPTEYRHVDIVRLALPLTIEQLFKGNGPMS